MSVYKIAVIVGSLRRDSWNLKLANAVVKLAPPELTFKQLQIGDLPLYNQDDDARQAAPVQRLKARSGTPTAFCLSRRNTTGPSPACLKTRWTTRRAPTVRTPGRENRPAFWAFRSASSARPWRNSICAMFWPFSICRRSPRPKFFFKPKTGCSIPTAASAPTAKPFCQAGWKNTPLG